MGYGSHDAFGKARRGLKVANILVIDDEAPMRRFVALALEKQGHAVAEAADGAEALKIMAERPVDLVITDLLMPEMDGVDVLSSIRKGGHTMPVIAMSGGGKVDSKSYLEVARALGAFATIAKPFELEHLLATVRDAIASRKNP